MANHLLQLPVTPQAAAAACLHACYYTKDMHWAVRPCCCCCCSGAAAAAAAAYLLIIHLQPVLPAGLLQPVAIKQVLQQQQHLLCILSLKQQPA
jgi:hypothetical protein